MEPGGFRFVAQCLSQLRYQVRNTVYTDINPHYV
jgi:hypothetical protein